MQHPHTELGFDLGSVEVTPQYILAYRVDAHVLTPGHGGHFGFFLHLCR